MVSTSSATSYSTTSRSSGTSGSPRASGSSQVPPPPPLPAPTNQEGQLHGSTAPSYSKTVASAEYKAWTMTNIKLRPSVSSTPEDLHMDDDMAPDAQVHSSDDEDIGNAHIHKVNLRQDWWKLLEEDRPATPEPAWSIASSDLPVLKNNWASALPSTYSPLPEDSLLAQTGDIAMFLDWHNVSKPLPLGGPPSQATNYDDVGLVQMVPDQMWIEEECKYDIADIAVTFWDKYGVQMIMRFNEIYKFSDGTLHPIDEALDYRVKEFKVNRMNSGLNTSEDGNPARANIKQALGRQDQRSVEQSRNEGHRLEMGSKIFEGNTRDLGFILEETGQEYDFTPKDLKNKSQMVEMTSRILVTPSGSASDRVRKIITVSELNRHKETLEDSTARQWQDFL
nr:hypothetical protein [Tanacetum cinerariifolium]